MLQFNAIIFKYQNSDISNAEVLPNLKKQTKSKTTHTTGVEAVEEV